MTNHPALQPVLAAGNVAMLTRYMEALTPPDPDDVTEDYATGYRAAVRAAVQLVGDMWRAAVIATDAVNLEMMQDVYADDDGALDDGDDFPLEYDDD